MYRLIVSTADLAAAAEAVLHMAVLVLQSMLSHKATVAAAAARQELPMAVEVVAVEQVMAPPAYRPVQVESAVLETPLQ